MADQRYDVVGIGNAIVDIIARADDSNGIRGSVTRPNTR